MLNEVMYPKRDAIDRGQLREKRRVREKGSRAPSACHRTDLITRQPKRSWRKELMAANALTLLQEK